MEGVINQIQRDVRSIVKQEEKTIQGIISRVERLERDTREELKTEEEREDIEAELGEIELYFVRL